MSRLHREAPCLLTAGLLAAAVSSPAHATQAAQATAAGGGAARTETRTVVAGEEFDRGGKWRYWFGAGYRKAWTTPVELPVLDLSTEAGGLATASHQTGWTGVVAVLLDLFGRVTAEQALETPRPKLEAHVVRQQVGGENVS